MKITTNLLDKERQTRTDFATESTMGVIVSEIPSYILPFQRVSWAIEATGYFFGMEHPNDPNARLSRMDGKALTTDAVEIELTYVRNFAQPVVTISTQLYQTETNKTILAGGLDPKGLATVVYKYPDTYELDVSLRGKTISKSPTIPKDSHDGIITIQRQEVTSFQLLLADVATYVNALNLPGWSFFPSAKDGSFRCVDVNGQRTEIPGVYNVSRSFAFRPVLPANPLMGRDNDLSQWDIDLYFRDHNTGEPPADIVAYSSVDFDGKPDKLPGGIRLGVPIYERKNFDNLIRLETA